MKKTTLIMAAAIIVVGLSQAHAAETDPFTPDEWNALTQFQQECASDRRPADCMNDKIAGKYGDHQHLFAVPWFNGASKIGFVKIPDETSASPAVSASGDGQIY